MVTVALNSNIYKYTYAIKHAPYLTTLVVDQIIIQGL